MDLLNTDTIKRQIKRLTKQLERYEIDEPHNVFNFFGGRDYGYITGRISLLEDLLDQLEEENKQ